MGWFGRWLGDGVEDWPRDPLLDPFRDAVWQLSKDGRVEGWVTTSVAPMRALPAFWLRQEQMWSQVHWADGRREFLEEDYGPWVTVGELLEGRFTAGASRFDRYETYDAVRVTGPERGRLWEELDHGVEPSWRG
ncbi:hypothetical protein [Arthrobacter woluwensis]|uniref:hypothetical protein n=1 Tax=Arthrobacter woluwensis TaxID=156980 RepID=UPI001AAF0455|nr:hypothetical protein [Arthrobacter woluwensis]QTF72205.1 hypothetical protein G8758_09460 [Arthrobacter woluwensis]